MIHQKHAGIGPQLHTAEVTWHGLEVHQLGQLIHQTALLCFRTARVRPVQFVFLDFDIQNRDLFHQKIGARNSAVQLVIGFIAQIVNPGIGALKVFEEALYGRNEIILAQGEPMREIMSSRPAKTDVEAVGSPSADWARSINSASTL